MLKTEILKKTEKIASAAYLLTGLFDDKEPLKWEIRSLSSRLISKSVGKRDIRSEAQEMLSLFTVAKNAGLVSETNHGIFETEITKLITGAEEAPKEALVTSFFEEPAAHALESKPTQTVSFIKDKTDAPERPRLMPRPEREVQKEKPLREFGAVAVKKNTRQSVIINLLKRKKEIMIKDVAPLIEGVSEKTIQRELLAMVDQGVIKKEGEKRWSRYSLA
jgi:hypothetical protein